jgi:hypothetical protein
VIVTSRERGGQSSTGNRGHSGGCSRSDHSAPSFVGSSSVTKTTTTRAASCAGHSSIRLFVTAPSSMSPWGIVDDPTMRLASTPSSVPSRSGLQLRQHTLNWVDPLEKQGYSRDGIEDAPSNPTPVDSATLLTKILLISAVALVLLAPKRLLRTLQPCHFHCFHWISPPRSTTGANRMIEPFPAA